MDKEQTPGPEQTPGLDRNQAIVLAVAALVLGAAGDGLLTDAYGVNVTLWICLLLTALWVLARRSGEAFAGDGRWLLLPAALFGAAFAWRDSPLLTFLNTLALGACLGLGALHARGGDLRRTGLVAMGVDLIVSGIQTLVGFFPVLTRDLPWGALRQGRWSGPTAAVMRGLLIAVPLLLAFGALFISADAVFENLVVNTFDFDLGNLTGHVFWTAVLACAAGGFLVLTFKGRPMQPVRLDPPRNGLGMVETGVVLGLLNALFGAFVFVQFRYLFGGAALVMATTDLTYAEYARRGFFELVAVAALVLPMLLLGHWLMPADRPAQQRMFLTLSGSLIAMLFVIMASAVQRMWLYQAEYGLTQQRLYASAFMGWLALLLLWFGWTVLRGRRERFAFGALVSGLAMVLALHAVNPDALIARVNVARAAEGGRPLDGLYLASLSADVVPILADSLHLVPEEQQREVANLLIGRWSVRQEDWRSWNWGRAAARKAVTDRLDQLRPLAGAGT